MNGRRLERRVREAAHAVLVLALLPVLVLGPVMGGMAAWVHSHDTSQEHAHLVASDVEHDAVSDWHDAQHRHAHEEAPDEEEEHPAPGFLVELPQVCAVVPGSSFHALVNFEAASLVSTRCSLELVDCTHRPDVCRCGWPPGARHRSGAVAVLRSSHALLI